jgi:hypothetical protein
MVGMREAQVEYPKPEIKKKIAAPILNCFGVRILIACSSTKIIKHLKYEEKRKDQSRKLKAESKEILSFGLSAFRF